MTMSLDHMTELDVKVYTYLKNQCKNICEKGKVTPKEISQLILACEFRQFQINETLFKCDGPQIKASLNVLGLMNLIQQTTFGNLTAFIPTGWHFVIYSDADLCKQ